MELDWKITPTNMNGWTWPKCPWKWPKFLSGLNLLGRWTWTVEYDRINVCQCDLFGHVQIFWSYSFGHVELVKWLFLLNWAEEQSTYIRYLWGKSTLDLDRFGVNFSKNWMFSEILAKIWLYFNPQISMNFAFTITIFFFAYKAAKKLVKWQRLIQKVDPWRQFHKVFGEETFRGH